MSTTCSGMAFFLANFTLQTPTENEQHHPHPPSISSLLPQDFYGNAQTLGKRSMSFSGIDICQDTNNNNDNSNNDNGEEDLSDEGSQMGGIGEKKRRLNMEQVRTLEKNFELGNKLEAERKMQLAKALGLQPRQIAIWFQNRRARWKTKQLEKDYHLLKTQFDALKAHNHALLAHNQKLQAQIMALKNREPTESINLNKAIESSCNNRSTKNNSKIKLDISSTPTTTIDQSPLDLSRPATTAATHFPTSAVRPNGPLVAQVLFQSPQETPPLKEENNFTNMFCSIDEQATFWPWLEQPNIN